MITKEIQFKHRGKPYQGKVILPETLQEAQVLIGPEDMLEAITEALEARFRKELVSRSKKRWQKIDLRALSDDQRAALKQLGLLK